MMDASDNPEMDPPMYSAWTPPMNSPESPTSTLRYRAQRNDGLPHLVERVARVSGLPNISITVDNHGNNACKLTRDGVIITLNPNTIEELSLRERYGTQGNLTLAAADLITVTHQVNRACDFTDSTFYIEQLTGSEAVKNARRFFNTIIDDIVIDRKLKKIPVIDRNFDAFFSRLALHDLREMPLHLQLSNALRILLLEKNPDYLIDEEVHQVIADIRNTGKEAGSSLGDLVSRNHSYAERHRLADASIYLHYRQLLKKDLARYKFPTLEELYAGNNFYGEIESTSIDVLTSLSDEEVKEYQEEMFNVTDKNLKDSVLPSEQESDALSEEEDDSPPGLMLPRTGDAEEDFFIIDEKMPGYSTIMKQWHTTIQRVAEILLTLSTPQESMAVPRYRHTSAIDGARLNPAALIDAQIQLMTGQPRPIWQPIEKRTRYQNLPFNGLDIFLLLDVSGSMGGENALYASALAICLIEGLQLARNRAEIDLKQGTVDVRVQLLAFGAGWAELTPLCKEPSQNQKEIAYYNLMHPNSNYTLINGALRHVNATASAYPERDVLSLVLSDGLFSDNLAAFKTVHDAPANVYTGHINIGLSSGIPITLHNETVMDPRVLPKKLQMILEGFLSIRTQF